MQNRKIELGSKIKNMPTCAESLESVNTVDRTIERLIKARPNIITPKKRTKTGALSPTGFE